MVDRDGWTQTLPGYGRSDSDQITGTTGASALYFVMFGDAATASGRTQQDISRLYNSIVANCLTPTVPTPTTSTVRIPIYLTNFLTT